jgi:hypothetical protein
MFEAWENRWEDYCMNNEKLIKEHDEMLRLLKQARAALKHYVNPYQQETFVAITLFLAQHRE